MAVPGAAQAEVRVPPAIPEEKEPDYGYYSYSDQDGAYTGEPSSGSALPPATKG